MKRYIILIAVSLCLLSLALAVVLSPPDAQAAGVVWVVDDDLADCPWANFSTIQQAIDNASADDIIIVCNGTYTENISINKSLDIRSRNGSDVTFINGNGSERAVNINASGVTFGGDGQGFNVSNAFIGIAMYTGGSGVGEADMSGNSVVGNVVHNCSDAGIRVDNEGSNTDIYSVTLLNNTVFDCDDGIQFDNCDTAGATRDNTVEGNEVYNCSSHGIYFENDESSGNIRGNDVEGNTVYDCGNNGICFENDDSSGDIYDNDVEGNTVYDCGNNGICFENDDSSGDIYDNDVEDNTVYNISEKGIHFYNDWSDGDIRNNDVLNNTVHDCSWAGISFENYDEGFSQSYIYENVVEGNTVYLCDRGIELENEWQSDGDIYNNDVLDNDVYLCDSGIVFDNDESDNSDIYGNDVEDNTVYECEEGILFENDENDGDIEDNEVLGNTVYNCSDVGIGFLNWGAEDIEGNTVAHNTVYNCLGGEFSAGISFFRESGTISGNTVFNNTVHDCDWGIDLREEFWDEPGPGGIYDNTVEQNTVYNCTDAGIDLWSAWEDSVAGNSVLNNTVYNCWGGEFGAGIMLFSGEDGNVSGNTIEGNEVYQSEAGILALSLWCGNISDNTIAGNTVNNTTVGIIMESAWCLGGFPFAGSGSATAPAEESGADGRHRRPASGGFSLSRVSGHEQGSVSGRSAAGDGDILGEEFGQPPLPFDLGIFDNTVAGNTVFNYEEVGIGLGAYEGGINYRNTVEGNEVYSFSEFIFEELPNAGIGVSSYEGLIGDITVADNTVIGNIHGIRLDNEGDGGIYESTIEGNTIFFNEVNIELYNDWFMTIAGIDIRDNVLYNQSLAEEEDEPQSGDGIWMMGCEYINISNNDIAYSAMTGVWIEESEYIYVASNRIFNNSEGISIWDSGYVYIVRNDILDNWGIGPLTGVYICCGSDDIDIHCNNIVGNGIGVANVDEASVDATWNWWGADDGPDGEGFGSGDEVWDALYWPWLNGSTATNVSLLALNATAVPSMVSVYDWDNLFGEAPNDIYTLGPSYTDIIVEFNCSENPCNLCGASINLSALLLQILPAGFVEDYVADWDPELQEDWEDWMYDLSEVEMDGGEVDGICFADYELWLELLFFPDEGDALGTFFEEEYDDGYELFMDLIFEELRLGQVQVPVDIRPCMGPPETIYVPLTVVDFQLPLDRGWNLRSTPLKLDSNWNTIGDAYDMGDGLYGLEAFVTWDTQSGLWVEPGPGAVFAPLDAYYIKMTERDQMGFIVDRDGPATLVSRDLYTGWNLVGMVPDFLYHNGSMPDACPFPAMDPWTTLVTVNGEWEVSINMIEDLYYMEEFYYRWVELEKPWYEKYFWQEPFTVFPNGSGFWEGPPFVSPGGGFWVFMDSDELLGGLQCYTPLPWRSIDCLGSGEPEP